MTTLDAAAPGHGHGHGHSAHAEAHGHEHDHHVCGVPTFVGILLILFVLTVLTVGVSHFDFGRFNMWIAMAIAAVKASLVISVFMHVLWDTTINRIFFLSSFLFLGLFFLFAFADLLARGDLVKAHARPAPLDASDISEWGPGTKEHKFFEQFKNREKNGKAKGH
ncbi:MAG: cytochrome C oxidase subunit IV family protein [Planctomycetes bacterium]|nr:cytochrome C oxidase subunit IV family protein [Planctomycetota bacterium]MCB9888142.1 cytochrome C oxidase subunit IV family protein [Planctomycetota bacterium]